jgi:hypothetical protein
MKIKHLCSILLNPSLPNDKKRGYKDHFGFEKLTAIWVSEESTLKAQFLQALAFPLLSFTFMVLFFATTAQHTQNKLAPFFPCPHHLNPSSTRFKGGFVPATLWTLEVRPAAQVIYLLPE